MSKLWVLSLAAAAMRGMDAAVDVVLGIGDGLREPIKEGLREAGEGRDVEAERLVKEEANGVASSGTFRQVDLMTSRVAGLVGQHHGTIHATYEQMKAAFGPGAVAGPLHQWHFHGKDGPYLIYDCNFDGGERGRHPWRVASLSGHPWRVASLSGNTRAFMTWAQTIIARHPVPGRPSPGTHVARLPRYFIYSQATFRPQDGDILPVYAPYFSQQPADGDLLVTVDLLARAWRHGSGPWVPVLTDETSS